MNADLTAKIREMMREHKIPGVAIGIYHDDEEYTQGYGVTNLDNPLPVNDDTLFQIGSITKTFVGTMAMMLADEGKLDLDKPIKSILPDFKVVDEEATEKATLRHLFTHTAGWVGDWFPSGIDQGSDAVKHYVETMAEDQQVTPLGELVSYNNAGFNLAGRVLEVVTGKVFSDLIKDMILTPLGMSDTYILPWELMTKRFATGHIPSESGVDVASPWFIGRSSGPAGGIVSSVKDMIKYIKFQLRRGNASNLLSKQVFEELHTPQLEYAPGHSVALTFWVDDHRAIRSIGHSGGTVGQISLLTIVPEKKFGLILFTNSANGRILNPEITNYALKLYLGLETPAQEILRLPDETLTEYSGEYSAQLTEVRVSVENGNLSISQKSLGGFPTADIKPEKTEYSPPALFGFYAPENIIGLEPSNKYTIAQFIRESKNKVSMIRIGMRLHKRK